MNHLRYPRRRVTLLRFRETGEWVTPENLRAVKRDRYLSTGEHLDTDLAQLECGHHVVDNGAKNRHCRECPYGEPKRAPQPAPEPRVLSADELRERIRASLHDFVPPPILPDDPTT